MRRAIPLTLTILTTAFLSTAGAAWLGGWRRQPCPPPYVLIVPEVSAEAEIRRVLTEQDAAWNKGDLEGYMAGYWKSSDLSFFSGKDRTRGWQATLERYVKKYRSDGRE